MTARISPAVWRSAWAVVVLDVALKFYVPTHHYARHEVVPKSVPETLLIVLVLGTLVIWRQTPWGAMLLAGIVCNRLDGLDGVVQNPIVIKLESGLYWSFNPADVAIQIGGAVFVTQTLWELGTWLLHRQADEPAVSHAVTGPPRRQRR